jgi:DNA-binding response OmpR family regulator
MNADVLIVDDNPDNLNTLSRTLESFGYNVIAAPGEELALQIATDTPPDLILLDIVMPGIDGYEICRRLKKNPATAEIPVIFITAKGEIDSLVEGFTVGGIDYITKPFKEEEVKARVETHLKIHQLTAELLTKNDELVGANEQLRQEIATHEQAEEARDRADGRLSLVSQREAR